MVAMETKLFPWFLWQPNYFHGNRGNHTDTERTNFPFKSWSHNPEQEYIICTFLFSSFFESVRASLEQYNPAVYPSRWASFGDNY